MPAQWLSIDLETRSTVDLRKAGVYVYAAHPTTDVWCAAYAFDDAPVRLWLPGQPVPADLVAHVAAGGKIRAWNATFERILWRDLLGPRYGWPHAELEQFYCTAAQAANLSLPRSLGDAGAALGLKIQKDADGRRLMLRMAKPREVEGSTISWWDDDPRLQRLYDYCKRDVEVERSIADRLFQLTTRERELYLLDQRINDRGVLIDQALVAASQAIVAQRLLRLNTRLAEITEGAVLAVSQVKRLSDWLNNDFGVRVARSLLGVDSLAKAAITAMLADPAEDDAALLRVELTPAMREALTIRREAAKSSTAKLDAMQIAAGDDARVRGVLLYYGAARTGRWSGRLIQPQNYPRGSDACPITEDLIATLLLGDDELLDLISPETPMTTVSYALRACLIAASGHRFIAADFSNIEGRVLAWLAGEQWKLTAYRAFDAGTGPDLYKVTAAGVYRVPIAEVTKAQRQIGGKIPELALGYQGGVVAFQKMAALYGVSIEDKRAEEIKVAWREDNPNIVAYWATCQEAAWNAVAHPGTTFKAGPVSYVVFKGFLWCRLPSGRHLCYARPHFARVKRPWDDDDTTADEWAEALCCMGNDNTHKWGRVALYGGLLVENCLAGDTEVLTPRGWVRITEVRRTDKVWDGVEWVAHGGVVRKGDNATIALDGVRMTPDHRVLTTKGWQRASSCEGLNRAAFRLPRRAELRGIERAEIALARAVPVRHREDRRGRGPNARQHELVRLPATRSLAAAAALTRDDDISRLFGLAFDARPLPTADASSLEELRGARDQSLRGVGEFRDVLARHGADVSIGVDPRTEEQQRRLLRGQLLLGDVQGASREQAQQSADRNAVGPDHGLASGGAFGDRRDDLALSFGQRLAAGAFVRGPGFHESVFDVLNAGPRRRFMVRGRSGPFLVHNCTQAVARDLLADAMLRVDAAPNYRDRIVLSIHDEVVAEVPYGIGSVDELEALLCRSPAWIGDCPIAAAGWAGPRFQKG